MNPVSKTISLLLLSAAVGLSSGSSIEEPSMGKVVSEVRVADDRVLVSMVLPTDVATAINGPDSKIDLVGAIKNGIPAGVSPVGAEANPASVSASSVEKEKDHAITKPKSESAESNSPKSESAESNSPKAESAEFNSLKAESAESISTTPKAEPPKSESISAESAPLPKSADAPSQQGQSASAPDSPAPAPEAPPAPEAAPSIPECRLCEPAAESKTAAAPPNLSSEPKNEAVPSTSSVPFPPAEPSATSPATAAAASEVSTTAAEVQNSLKINESSDSGQPANPIVEAAAAISQMNPMQEKTFTK